MSTNDFSGIAAQLKETADRLHINASGSASVRQIGMAMFYAAREYDRERQAKFRNFSQPSAPLAVSDVLLAEIMHYIRFADAAYATRAIKVAQRCPIMPSDILSDPAPLWMSQPFVPAHFVAVERSTRRIVICIRGTKELADVLTDLSCERRPLLHSHGHRGMISAAEALDEKISPAIAQYIECDDPYRIVITGHSMGGSVGAALALQMRARGGAWARTRCFTYGPSPCIESDLVSVSRECIVSVVLGVDVVTRLSAASLDRLLLDMNEYEWQNQAASHFETTLASYNVPSALSAWAGATASTWLGEWFNRSPWPTSRSSRRRSSRRQSSGVPRILWRSSTPDPIDLFIPGRIFHIQHGCKFGGETLVEITDPSELNEVQPSAWMIHDHGLANIKQALASSIKRATLIPSDIS